MLLTSQGCLNSRRSDEIPQCCQDLAGLTHQTGVTQCVISRLGEITPNLNRRHVLIPRIGETFPEARGQGAGLACVERVSRDCLKRFELVGLRTRYVTEVQPELEPGIQIRYAEDELF